MSLDLLIEQLQMLRKLQGPNVTVEITTWMGWTEIKQANFTVGLHGGVVTLVQKVTEPE